MITCHVFRMFECVCVYVCMLPNSDAQGPWCGSHKVVLRVSGVCLLTIVMFKVSGRYVSTIVMLITPGVCLYSSDAKSA